MKIKIISSPNKGKYASGGHLFWPGGPKNPPYYGDIVYGRGLGAVDEGSLMDNMMIMGPQDYYIPNFYSNVLGANAGYREVADKPKSTVQPKPFAQSPIKQNPTPIYLSDDSGMNRYVAATNPMVVSDNMPTRNSIINSGNSSTSKGSTSDLHTPGLQTYLRYAPVLGSAIGLGYTLFNKPDYEYANELEEAADQYAGGVPRVSPSLLGDYLAYNPFDRLFYANELGAQAAATRSAIMNQSNSNAGQAMAGLLAADYNSTIGLGKLFREGEEYNLAQRQKVAEFNRATNMYNSEADLKAQMANAELDKAKASLLLDAKMKALGLKQSEDQAWDAALAANLTGLFDNIGNIGWEAVNRNMINDNDALYYGMTRSGRSPYKGGYAKDGGYLTIKNRRKR